MGIEINYTTGYAGTGKSYNLLQKVKTLPADTLVVIAPTHKALHRLYSELDETIEARTIHSLLGWIPAINTEALVIEHIDTTIKLNNELNEYKNIVIDEAGMMGQDMLMDIIGKIEESMFDIPENEQPAITLHLYLDPYQLLPVKSQQIDIDPDNTINLTKQHRSDSIDIVNLYTKFVHYLQGLNTDDLTTEHSENVLGFDITKFKEGDRLLAYTNNAVGSWNRKIAKHLGINGYIGQEVQLGNRLELTKVKDFVTPTTSMLLDWYRNKTLVLQNSNINKNFINQALSALISNNHILFILDTNGKVYPIILHIDKANIILKKARELAMQDKSKFSAVYALGRAFIMDYSFATTIHKAQGSEFSTVFIDKANIQKSIFNNSYKNYARMMYVAISRAKKEIYI